MGRFDLTDRQWERLEPLLPPRRPRTGRPNEDHRRILNGIVWVLRTGAPWRDLPERYGPVGTVSSRFYRWRAAGFVGPGPGGAPGRGGREGRGRLGPPLRRRHHRARASTRRRRPPDRRKRGMPDEALGRSRGGFSTKVHLRVEGNGRPITAVLTGGERHEQLVLEAVLDTGAIRRQGPGRPRLRPRRVAGDKGYSSPKARRSIRRRGIVPVIPTKRNERRDPAFDREAYRLRNRVERLINRLKQNRRIATRYEKRGINYLAMLTIGMIRLWL
jgi:transposase